MNTGFRKRLLAGDRLIGTMVTLGYPEMGEILAGAGFDWLFLDAEHSPMTAAALQHVMQGAGAEMPCLVRLAAGDQVSIKKALDIGAAGIISPMVNTAEQAAEVVRWAKYWPQGSRGVGLGRASGYGRLFQEYLESANEETVVVVQAEHIEAVENIAEIIQVPGVDAVFVGPYDLSASLGLMGQVTHPDVQAAIGRVTQVCREAGVPLGIFGVTAKAVQPFIEQGYTLIVAGTDALLLGAAAAEIFNQLSGR
jgi:2-dehydro-3-deoxyglucarate aldolase